MVQSGPIAGMEGTRDPYYDGASGLGHAKDILENSAGAAETAEPLPWPSGRMQLDNIW